MEGRPPFGDGDNAIALLHAVAAGRFAPPTHAGPLTDVLLDLLRTDPTARPTMARAADRLRAQPAAARPPATRLDLNPADLPPRDDRTPPRPTGPAPRPTVAASAPPTPWPTGPHRTTVAPHPAAPPPKPVRGGRGVLVAVAAAAVVGLVVLVLVSANGHRPTDSAAGATTSTTTTSDNTPSPAQLEQAVAEYFALLPKDVAGAWERVGPGLRSRGRQEYEKSWRNVEDLAISSPPAAAGPDTVTVGIDFTGADGRKYRATHRLRLVVQDGTPLIDSDEVLSSQRIDEDHRKDDEDEKEGKDGKDDRKRGGGKSGEG